MPDDDETLDPILPPTETPPGTPPAPASPPLPPAPPAPPPLPSTPPQRRGMSEEERARIEDHKARALKKQLKDLFGTDDPAEVERIRNEYRSKAEKHDQLLQAEEQRKREQMTEVQRLQEDLQRVTNERDQLKAELDSVKRDKVAFEQDAKIRSIAVNHIAPKWIKWAMTEFRDYVMALAPADQKRLDEKRTDAWFKNFAKNNEIVAIDAKPSAPAAEPPGKPPAAPAAPPATPPARGVPPLPRRVPAGARPDTAPKPNASPASDPLAGKTPKPGQPNSMNREELKIYAQRQGIRYPI